MSVEIYPSLADVRDKVFVPLPEEQQITEEELLKLERQIAHSTARTDRILTMSEKYIEEQTENFEQFLDSEIARYIMSK